MRARTPRLAESWRSQLISVSQPNPDPASDPPNRRAAAIRICYGPIRLSPQFPNRAISRPMFTIRTSPFPRCSHPLPRCSLLSLAPRSICRRAGAACPRPTDPAARGRSARTRLAPLSTVSIPSRRPHPVPSHGSAPGAQISALATKSRRPITFFSNSLTYGTVGFLCATWRKVCASFLEKTLIFARFGSRFCPPQDPGRNSALAIRVPCIPEI